MILLKIRFNIEALPNFPFIQNCHSEQREESLTYYRLISFNSFRMTEKLFLQEHPAREDNSYYFDKQVALTFYLHAQAMPINKYSISLLQSHGDIRPLKFIPDEHLPLLSHLPGHFGFIQ